MPSRHAYADSVYPAAFAAYPVTAALTDGRIYPYKRPLPARWHYAPHLRHFCPMQMGRENGPGRRAFALHRYPVFEGFYDDVTGFPLIFTVDFCVGHFAGAGNGTVEIVGVGGTGCRN